MKINAFIAIALLLILGLNLINGQSGYTIYEVKSGDTLWKIAKEDSAQMKRIQELNGITNPAGIQVGQKLKIPNGTTTTPASENYTIYVVKPGDSLWKIAKEDSAQMKRIQELNGITNPAGIQVGQKLKIPKESTTTPNPTPNPTPTNQNYTIYVVKPGDSLWKIAKEDSAQMKRIQELNGITNPADIQVGQKLKIPKESTTTPNPNPNPTPTNENYTIYVVKAGDTLFKIAKEDNALMKKIQELNGISNPADIQVGQKLKIPKESTTTPNPTPSNENYTIYVVKSGDTLFKIAKEDNALMKKIQELNGIANPADIQVGQKLKIPKESTTTPTNQNYTIYVVKAGDTLFKIAKEDNALMKKIQELNGIANPADIQVGQKLKIPKESTTTPTNENYTIYVVKAGDTLFKIAKEDNDLMKKIQELNGITNPADIQVGQKLKIPKESTTTPTNENYTIYVVKSGDTLFKIAKEDNALMKKIQELNGIANPADIQVGQKLKIPKESTTTPTNENYIIYVVKSGDTLFKIAKEDNSLMKIIQELNGIANPADIQVGQKLKIPKESTTTPTNQNYTIYVVKAGDTLFKIAKEDNALMKKIQELNGIANPADIQVGQKLKIPKESTTTNQNYTIYVVKAGDTLFKIAKEDNALMKKIQELNGIANPADIQVGQKLKIPKESTTTNENYTIYVVKSGDTLFKIAKEDNALMKKIQELNGIANPADIQVGQKLKIPKESTTTPTNENYTIYVVKAGDTLFKIAKEDNDLMKKIQELNGITNPADIQVGQKLKIPKESTTTNENYTIYVVKAGDTLFKIAKEDNALMKKIQELNGITNPADIQVGQKLKIPVLKISGNPDFLKQNLTKALYQTLFPQRNEIYTYNSLIQAAESFPGFSDTENEMLAFLTTISFEGDYLRATDEYNYEENTKIHGYDPGFHGRGPIQLTQKTNYLRFSQAIFKDDRLVKNPDLLTQDGKVAFQSAVWYWMNDVKKYFPQSDAIEGLRIATLKGVRPALPHLDKRILRLKEIQQEIATYNALFRFHTVVQGESLSIIANNDQEMVQIVLKLNNIVNANEIKVGQKLRIPLDKNNLGEPYDFTKHKYRVHVVVAGDSLSKIAGGSQDLITAIMKFNGIKSANLIFIGQKIRIPLEAEEKSKYDFITVKEGDTLYKIARENKNLGIEIFKLNDLKTDKLTVGQVLKLSKDSKVKERPYTLYSIQEHDTLEKITGGNKEMMDLINKWNGKYTFSWGKAIKVPKNLPITIPEWKYKQEYTFYKVKSGDSLYKLSGFDWWYANQIMIHNYLGIPSVPVGHVLALPKYKFEYRYNEVQEGDTIASLSFHILDIMDEMLTVNEPREEFQKGQKFNFPIRRY